MTNGPGGTPPKVLIVSKLIFDYLAVQPGPVAAQQIFKAIKGRRQSKIKALNLLKELAQVTTSGKGVKGDPCLFASVKPKSSSGAGEGAA